MKPQPQLHPRDLLSGMRDELITTPAQVVKLKHHLLSDNGEVEMLLAQDGSFQLQCKSSEATMQLCHALHRLLNVWDIEAPRWIWQMNAMLDPVLRQIALDESKNIRPNDPPAASEPLCMCKDRLLSACPGEWEPGCDLGANDKYARVYQPSPEEQAALDAMIVSAKPKE